MTVQSPGPPIVPRLRLREGDIGEVEPGLYHGVYVLLEGVGHCVVPHGHRHHHHVCLVELLGRGLNGGRSLMSPLLVMMDQHKGEFTDVTLVSNDDLHGSE